MRIKTLFFGLMAWYCTAKNSEDIFEKNLSFSSKLGTFFSNSSNRRIIQMKAIGVYITKKK